MELRLVREKKIHYQIAVTTVFGQVWHYWCENRIFWMSSWVPTLLKGLFSFLLDKIAGNINMKKGWNNQIWLDTSMNWVIYILPVIFPSLVVSSCICLCVCVLMHAHVWKLSTLLFSINVFIVCWCWIHYLHELNVLDVHYAIMNLLFAFLKLFRAVLYWKSVCVAGSNCVDNMPCFVFCCIL
jgi:hypothetical protein